ncbi:hypothetical protein LEMLEM_LOCUS27858 [Lemmus lemmus]
MLLMSPGCLWYPHVSSHLSVTPSSLHRHQACRQCTNIHACETRTHIK